MGEWEVVVWLVSLAVGTARGDLNASTAHLAGSLASGLAVMMAILGKPFILKLDCMTNPTCVGGILLICNGMSSYNNIFVNTNSL